LEAAGGTISPVRGGLLGGHFGTWLHPRSLADLPLDAKRLREEHGASLGCGVLALLPEQGCGIVEASRILTYLAAESAGQCGPCVNGLSDLSKVMARIAASQTVATDLDRIHRWSALVRGPGACHHPDGAVGQLASALDTLADHLGLHIAGLAERLPGHPSIVGVEGLRPSSYLRLSGGAIRAGSWSGPSLLSAQAKASSRVL
jgi:NADH:ubiquinone oxidoreductase subunit F (NADH-binding)